MFSQKQQKRHDKNLKMNSNIELAALYNSLPSSKAKQQNVQHSKLSKTPRWVQKIQDSNFEKLW